MLNPRGEHHNVDAWDSALQIGTTGGEVVAVAAGATAGTIALFNGAVAYFAGWGATEATLTGGSALALEQEVEHEAPLLEEELEQIVSIFKAPQPGMVQELLENGFDPAKFPGGTPYADGNIYSSKEIELAQ